MLLIGLVVSPMVVWWLRFAFDERRKLRDAKRNGSAELSASSAILVIELFVGVCIYELLLSVRLLLTYPGRLNQVLWLGFVIVVMAALSAASVVTVRTGQKIARNEYGPVPGRPPRIPRED